MEGIDPRIKDTMWSVGINLAAILISGIKLDSSEWILFNYLQQVFGARWPAEYTKPGGYVWISAGLIREQLAALPDISGVSDATLWRRLKSLEDAGLVVRYENNQKETKCYLAPGPAADQFMPLPISKMKEGSFKNEKGPISKMKDYSNTINSNTNTHSSDPLTPLQGETDGQKKLSKKRERSPKTRTAEDSLSFYKTQIEKLHESPPPHDQVAAARRKSYEGMVEWLRDGDPLQAPGGTATTLLRMGDPLSFDQWESFMVDYGMNVRQIKHYLLRMHNWTERHKNKSIYNTICKWWDDDGKAGRRPPANPPHNGQSNTPQISVEVPRPQKKEYSA